MKLEEQSYQILDRWKIEIIWHTELLWINKQIIRMRDIFFSEISNILDKWEEVSLYNHYNPINSDLICEYTKNKEENNLALLVNIIDSNSLWSIIDGWSLTEVEVYKMNNIFFETINKSDLEKSIAFNSEETSVSGLIEWMSKDFYDWKLSVEEIESYQRLFFRQIKFPN